MIELVNVSKNYNDKVAIDNLNYTFKDKGLYWIKGDSGSGKTTLLNIISGRIKFDGVVNVNEDIFFLSFDDYLIKDFTVRENIELHKNIFTHFPFSIISIY